MKKESMRMKKDIRAYEYEELQKELERLGEKPFRAKQIYEWLHVKLADRFDVKFTVGRAIYKGILQFITSQHDKDYVVQPLPVSNFAIRFGKKKNTLELSWKGEDDPHSLHVWI